MRVAFSLSGEGYSAHKGALKKILAKHGLKWRGRMENVWWGSAKEKLLARYDRDEARDVTTAAHLTWEGRVKSPFLNDLKAWVFEAGGKEARAATAEAPDVRAVVERELRFWEAISKPDFDRMAASGMPKKWLEWEKQSWKRRREAKRQELRAQLTG